MSNTPALLDAFEATLIETLALAGVQADAVGRMVRDLRQLIEVVRAEARDNSYDSAKECE